MQASLRRNQLLTAGNGQWVAGSGRIMSTGHQSFAASRLRSTLADQGARSNMLSLNQLLQPKQKKLDIMLMSDRFNSLSQRVCLELEERGHKTYVIEPDTPEEMVSATRIYRPDLVISPFLTKRIPAELWSRNRLLPFLVVHPGIEGDRGLHSIDWALKQGETEWGVTVLEAADEMDAGDIWSTKNFPIRRADVNTLTKSSLYTNEVTEAAVDATLETVDSFLLKAAPRPLDYADKTVRGQLQRKMTKAIRRVDWEDVAENVARQIRASDSNPGAVAHFQLGCKTEDQWSKEFRVFGANVEGSTWPDTVAAVPGTILGQRDNAVLIKCGQGSVWISHVKSNKLKLPATYWLQPNAPHIPPPSLEVLHGTYPDTFQEIWTTVKHGVCYVHFQFYNGAMSTSQCRRLQAVLHHLKSDNRFGVVVLMGGHNFFSNGIHLNVIEHAADPASESWESINAINDVVREIFTMSNKLVIAALRGNAGAGGAMMALAADIVWARDGVVLNPSYSTMHLYGSEYHTHFLPLRVGKATAEELTTSTRPILATQGKAKGLVTDTLGRYQAEFLEAVQARATQLARQPILGGFLKDKHFERSQEKWLAEVETCRRRELQIMRRNFTDPDYHAARKRFVYH